MQSLQRRRQQVHSVLQRQVQHLCSRCQQRAEQVILMPYGSVQHSLQAPWAVEPLVVAPG
jgi:hypothetical protein